MREIGTEELMKRVSFVFQDCHLFKDTLLNNIRAARPQAAEAEVRRALEAARCEDIIEKMPQGSIPSSAQRESIYREVRSADRPGESDLKGCPPSFCWMRRLHLQILTMST